MNKKATRIALTCISLLTAGCILIPSPYSDHLKPVAERYGSIKSGSSRAAIEAQLGKPSREEETGSCVWETRFDQLNYALLKVSFDRNDTAEKVEITRAHGKSGPGYKLSAVTTR
jgi:hypothetical protein